MTLNYFYCVTYWTDLTKFMYVATCPFYGQERAVT